MNTESHAPGTFCWLDLSTKDATAAKQFYQTLYGWTTVDTDMGYTMCSLRDRQVCGLYQDPSPEIPPHWNSYVCVADVDAAASRARALGATVVVEPFDVMEHGRMAMIQDPTSAHLCLWQPIKHPGMGVRGEHGAPCWFELDTRDTPQAETFYTNLFGWQAQRWQNGYVVFAQDGRQVAGMLQITEEMGPVPPNWLPHFAVSDCDATAQRVTEIGGRLLVPPMEVPETCRFAIIQDPTGAVSAILTMF